MPYRGICKNCGESFEGRSNQLYCQPICKNEFNNALKSREREYINNDFKSLENNIKVLHHLLDKRVEEIGTVFKSDLQKFGFDTQGPFRVLPSELLTGNRYRVGKYELNESIESYTFRRVG